jgi:hypothetical protein
MLAKDSDPPKSPLRRGTLRLLLPLKRGTLRLLLPLKRGTLRLLLPLKRGDFKTLISCAVASNLYARGRVYKIVNDWQLLLANPPLQNLGSYKPESNGHDITPPLLRGAGGDLRGKKTRLRGDRDRFDLNTYS